MTETKATPQDENDGRLEARGQLKAGRRRNDEQRRDEQDSHDLHPQDDRDRRQDRDQRVEPADADARDLGRFPVEGHVHELAVIADDQGHDHARPRPIDSPTSSGSMARISPNR